MAATLNYWQEQNDRFLQAAVSWIRLRLLRLAEQGLSSVPMRQSNAVVPSPGRWEVISKPVVTSHDPQPVPTSANVVTDEQVAEAAAAMDQAAETDPPPALVLLSRRFGLSQYEQQVLLLCAAMEFDTRIAGLCEQIHGELRRPYPTFALAMALFDEPAWDAMSPDRPLRFWRLIEITQPGTQPLTMSCLRADERIVNYIKGLNVVDDRLALMLSVVQEADVPLPPSQRLVVDRILQQLQEQGATGKASVIQLVGGGTSSKQLIAREVARALRVVLYRLPSDTIPTALGDMETFSRLWQRETSLLPVRLYVDLRETERGVAPDAAAQRMAAVKRIVNRSHDILFIDTRDAVSELSEQSVIVDVQKPTAVEQRTIWAQVIRNGNGELPALLAGQFDVEADMIHRLGNIARVDASDPEAVARQIWQLCCIHTRPHLDTLAKRVAVKATWDDIVLPAETLRLLRHIADQVRHRTRVYDEWGYRDLMNRGFGISALFAGESGTGKTMAAEILANDLHVDLYRIDLSSVVSKYIGETEKNLSRLFDAAEHSGAILLFDEADALFGKRSEVKDAHDRYANIEINYLLQRMEAYRGVAILTTNMKSALDQAFARRLRFIVNFPYPGVAERKHMWQKAFSPGVPVGPLDYDRLARFNATGGMVHNAGLNAAFLAAKSGGEVTMPIVLEAIRMEFRKLDRPINDSEFRWLEPAEVKG